MISYPEKNQEECINANNFKLTFYASFQCYNETIGLKLLEALSRYCERNNRDNFKLVKRLKFEGIGASIWDRDFLEKELIKSKQYRLDRISRVWVCGPPQMN